MLTTNAQSRQHKLCALVRNVYLITGTILQYLILAIICEIPNLSPWFILLSIIPLFFTGGFMALLAAILCYINDITAPENRGTRYNTLCI